MKLLFKRITRGIIYLIENTEKVMLRIIQVGLLFTILILFLQELNNFEKDTITITNYGFAILLGLASISFSWASSMSDEEASFKLKVKKCGQSAIFAAITFLFGSAFKYLGIDHDIKSFEFLSNPENYAHFIPRLLALACFMFASFRTIRVFNVLIEILIEKGEID